MGSVVAQRERDPGYMTRCYRRYIAMLEERFIDAQDMLEETATTVLAMLKSVLLQTPAMILPVGLMNSNDQVR